MLFFGASWSNSRWAGESINSFVVAFIKASHLQANIESIDLLPAAAVPEVKRRAAQAIATGMALSRSHWAPLQLDVLISEAIYDVVGARGLRNLNAEAIRRSGDGSLLRPIRDAALRILGARPDAILRFVPQAWGAIFKDVGEATWLADADKRGGTIVVNNQPQVALDSRAWAEGCAGAIDGVYGAVGATGTVVSTIDRAARTLTITCRW